MSVALLTSPALSGPVLAANIKPTTERVSVPQDGGPANGQSVLPAISADGRYVAFESEASNLVFDSNAASDVFVRDRMSSVTERVSVSTGGAQADGDSFDPAISADGRYVAFESEASLVPGDTNFSKEEKGFYENQSTGPRDNSTQSDWSNSMAGNEYVAEHASEISIANDRSGFPTGVGSFWEAS